jgi:hypothetical protein
MKIFNKLAKKECLGREQKSVSGENKRVSREKIGEKQVPSPSGRGLG